MNRIYDVFEESIAFLFFAGIFVLMVFGVFTRYLFDTYYPWNMELCRYSFVWLAFAGAAFVRKDDSHIKIVFLVNYLNRKLPLWARRAIWFFREILTVAFLIALTYLGFILANKTWRFKSQAMQIPQFYLYISVTVGGLLYLYRELRGAILDWKTNLLQRPSDNKTGEIEMT